MTSDGKPPRKTPTSQVRRGASNPSKSRRLRTPKPAPNPIDAQAFFGFSEKPFALSPDPKFLYRSRSHGTAFDCLLEAIRQVEGLIALTGDIGTGKTTLYRALLEQVAETTFTAVLLDPLASREEFLKTLVVDFGIVSMADLKEGRLRGASRTELNYLLQEFLVGLPKTQASALVVIDEAQNLTPPLWEEVRILSDAHSRETPIHVLLVGQPNLRARLSEAEMQRIDQRISVHCTLEPLNRNEVARFIDHRLATTHPKRPCTFETEAIDSIFHISAGVPRLISLICDRALHEAFVQRETTIGYQIVQIASTRLISAPPPVPVESPVAESNERISADEVSGRMSDWLTGLDTAVSKTPKAPLDTSAPRMSREWSQPHIPLLKRILGFP